MGSHEVIRTIGDKVLKELINSYYAQESYYLSNTINYLFKDEEDALFTSNEDIINYVKKLLADKYTLEVIPIQRILKSQDPDGEDMPFEDTQLKIVLK